MKHAKKLLCLALAMVMSLSLVACSSSGDGKDDGSSPSAGIDHDREVVYGSASLITNFNVKYVTAQNDLQALDQVYDALVRKVNGKFCGQLAESWEISEDGLCYTFHLRRGVKFHNGLEMTAEDVKFTYDKGAAGPLGAGLFGNYERCESVDDYTVNIYLTAPYAGFLYGVASRLGGICSKAYNDEVGDEGYLIAPIGTGPYTLDEVINGEKIVLRANDGYWRGEPAI